MAYTKSSNNYLIVSNSDGTDLEIQHKATMQPVDIDKELLGLILEWAFLKGVDAAMLKVDQVQTPEFVKKLLKY